MKRSTVPGLEWMLAGAGAVLVGLVGCSSDAGDSAEETGPPECGGIEFVNSVDPESPTHAEDYAHALEVLAGSLGEEPDLAQTALGLREHVLDMVAVSNGEEPRDFLPGESVGTLEAPQAFDELSEFAEARCGVGLSPLGHSWELGVW